jgi:hypothetical protein
MQSTLAQQQLPQVRITLSVRLHIQQLLRRPDQLT